MKQFLRFLCVGLAAAFLLTAIPMMHVIADDEYEDPAEEPALVEGDYTYYLINEGAAATIHSYTGEEVELELPETLGGVPVTAIDAFAFIASPIESVVLPDTLTEIGYAAFCLCGQLHSVQFPTGLQRINASAFEECTALETLDLPAGLLSIGVNAFGSTGWYAAQQEGPLYIGSVYYGYKGHMPPNNNMVIENGTLALADAALAGQYSMRSVTLPDGLLTIGEAAFFMSYALERVQIPASVTYIAPDAFDSISTTIAAPEHSYAAQFANEHAINYEAVATDRVPGDVNNDGVANTIDCRIIIAYLIAPNDPVMFSAEDSGAADFDGDGSIEASDCRKLMMSLYAAETA